MSLGGLTADNTYNLAFKQTVNEVDSVTTKAYTVKVIAGS